MMVKKRLLATIVKLSFIVRQRISFFILGSSLVLTLLIWFFTLQSYAFIGSDPFLFLSKIVALLGTVGICWTFILATREKVLEVLFGGLDKMYHAHQTMGKLSFALICLHPFFQFMRFVPHWSKAFGLFVPGTVGAIDLGLSALVLMIVLIALTLWIPIPYHIWKRTHEFFIVVLILAFLHIFFINKQVNASVFLSIWLYGFIAAGIASYIYIRFLYRFFGPRFSYVVADIKQIRKKTWNVYLNPTHDERLTYQPGQFVYISFNNEKLGKEVHPFSLSSFPGQPFLRISVKNLGDYTARLDYLQVNDFAKIWGPYGCFYEKYLYDDKDAVLIAGGIGITPFLSMIGFEAHRKSKRKTYILYCIKDEQRADFDKELNGYAAMNPSIIYIRHCSDESGYLDVKTIKELCGLEKKNFFLCGPKPMMDSFIKQLTQAGVKNSRIVFEDFNFI